MSRCADLGFRVQAGPLSTLEQYFHVLSGDEDEGEDTVADTLPGLGGAAAAVVGRIVVDVALGGCGAPIIGQRS